MMRELQPEDPAVIGPYRLRGRLGAGGMGRVYLGLSPGGGPVAVKVIRADLAQDPEFLARFRREVIVARKVSGLYTAPVIDADLDGPVPWLATAYVPGPSLADAVSQHGPLPPGSVLALGRGLAEGLSAIHGAGVVHRDLKPANVLLAEDGPRVIDFGISRAAEASALTHTGLVVGSPGFMSPEQAEGHLVGPPSDIFSLGAVLAFAATGLGPFGTGSTPALVYRVVHGLPDLGKLPAEVRPLIERCLDKNPARRPTAAQLLTGAQAVHPATGWLPEPMTRGFSRVGPTARAPVTVTTARPASSVPPAAPSGDGRAARRAGRPPRGGRRRSLVAAAILAGLAGAGITAGVTLTAGSVPVHAAQSVQQDAGGLPAQGNQPASAPASPTPPASSTAAAAGISTSGPQYTQAQYTQAPYTQAPYTQAPYTQAPYTQAPYTQAPSTPAASTAPPATMTPPATSSPRPSALPSTSTSSPYSAPSTPAPTTSTPATPAGY